MNELKIALVHDWLTGMRGGEQVLLEFCRLFPSADIFTLIHVPGKLHPEIEKHRITTSFLQKIPGIRSHYRKFLPLFPVAMENFDLTGYDLVLSTSHCVAKGIITRPDALHVSYIHSPMRYIWDLHFTYFPAQKGNVLARAAYRFFANFLRMWDVASSSRVDFFVANSSFVARRIRKFYHRESAILNPPVNVDHFATTDEVADYYVVFSSLVPYKRVDLAVDAFAELGLPLKVIGTGPELANLQKRASANVEFLGWQSDAEVARLLSQAKALVFPGLEDFGIIPVEANACGTPVIAFGRGGVQDSISPLDVEKQVEQPTGLFFYEQSVESLVQAIRSFEENEIFFNDRPAIRRHTFRFQNSLFRQRFFDFLLFASKDDFNDIYNNLKKLKVKVEKRRQSETENGTMPTLGEAVNSPQVTQS
ncbi:MAG: glycosyltransferase [Deferribacteres bacterium]|nr:glycosyltransferase [candidate division KSB1 bacterium]MCB9504093.1 glycosyltransferase [Deferribacteres bacterium]